jgi:hypothetical protein
VEVIIEYQIQNSDQIIDHWIRVFEALSLEHFENFSSTLEFTTPVSNELKETAKAFSLSVLKYLGRNTPQELDTPLFIHSEVDPLIQIWNNTFSQLKSIGYAEAVYSWGQKTYRLSTDPRLSSISDWDILLTDWALDSNDPKWMPIQLSFGTIAKLQSIIMQYEAYAQQMRFDIKQIQEEPYDAWEEYSFNTLQILAWLNIIGQSEIRFAKWSTIFLTLSFEELRILDRWGYDTFTNHDIKNYFSLAEFSNNLSAQMS